MVEGRVWALKLEQNEVCGCVAYCVTLGSRFPSAKPVCISTARG